MAYNPHSGPKVRTGFEKEEVRRFRFEPPDLADLGIKALVPTKNGELERRSLSKICEGARGAAGPPPGGLGGWKPPRNSRGSGGRQPPSKNNFMDPEPGPNS